MLPVRKRPAPGCMVRADRSPEVEDHDDTYMREAIELARRALDDDVGGPFGSVVVKDGRVVGRGRNRVLADRDPTAHAEVLAVRDACRSLGTHDLTGCTVYASSEPCPMCLGALLWARVARIVYAVDRAGAAEVGFDDVFFYAEIERPADQREVPMVHLVDPEALRVMEAWAQREDRQSY